MKIRFDGKVAIVTGAGQGLGRAHALALAARGAKLVVNDLGGSVDGTGGSQTVAESVVAEIVAAGGEAIANGANVTRYGEVAAMVEAAAKRWGRVDILVNNAGILRDKSFSKLELADFRAVVDVHLMGSVNCTKACWELMRQQNYGRVVMTTSSAGLYGNFGQAAYSAAKLGLVGFMNTLAKEGAKNNIRVNAVSPGATTRMTESLLAPEQIEMFAPERVSPAICFLASEDAPTRTIVTAGGGTFAVAKLYETEGVWLPPEQQTPEGIAQNWGQICDTSRQQELQAIEDQMRNFAQQATIGMARKH